MKREGQENLSAKVTEATRSPQAEDIRDRWSWVAHGTWTERMLTRLEESEPTTKWFRLWEKVYAPKNLEASYWKVYRNQGSSGVDGQKVDQMEQKRAQELEKLEQELSNRTYRPYPARRVWIPKEGSPEKRPLGIPTVRDRVVQGAVRHVLEPIFEKDFSTHSYGFRPGRGCRQAVERVEELLREGNTWCVDVDLKSYFDTIPHDRLMGLVQERVVDGNILKLLRQFLKAGVMEELKGWEPTEEGTPQGAVISPLLANLYLNPLDHAVAGEGWEMVRYADDFVVMCPTQEQALQVLDYLRTWTEAAGLTLHPTKTRIVNSQEEGFDFLGWHFRGHKKWPRKKSVQKLRNRLRPLSRRSQDKSLKAKVEQINPILRGWHGYFKTSVPSGLRDMDGWLRRRLRAMLRKSEKRPGFGLSHADSRRWPNRWFAEQGLFSLEHGSCNYG